MAEARRKAAEVSAAGRFGNYTCLHRSLALLRMLQKAGIPGELRIGVLAPALGPLRFHAWVESHGIVVNDAPDVANTYQVFEGSLGAVEGFE